MSDCSARDIISEVLTIYQDRDLGDPSEREFFAAEIDQALGGLERERRPANTGSRAKPCNKCSHNKGEHGAPCGYLMRNFTECGCPSYEYTEPTTEWAGRFVTAWTPEEAV